MLSGRQLPLRLLSLLVAVGLCGCPAPSTTVYLDLSRVPPDFTEEPFDEGGRPSTT